MSHLTVACLAAEFHGSEGEDPATVIVDAPWNMPGMGGGTIIPHGKKAHGDRRTVEATARNPAEEPASIVADNDIGAVVFAPDPLPETHP